MRDHEITTPIEREELLGLLANDRQRITAVIPRAQLVELLGCEQPPELTITFHEARSDPRWRRIAARILERFGVLRPPRILVISASCAATLLVAFLVLPLA